MAGAPKGNKNALKHGLWAVGERAAASGKVEVATARERVLRDPSFAIEYLEDAILAIGERMRHAKGEEFTRLANSLALAATALFNGHRTIAFLTGGVSPVEEAIRELEALSFEED